MPRKPFAPRAVSLLSLLALVAASLACNTVQRWLTLEGPEAQATDAAATSAAAPTKTPRPTRTPAPSATPGASPTPGPTQPIALDLEQFRAAMRPEHADDVEAFAQATRYFIDVAVTFDGEQSATLTGSERIRYTNRQDAALNEIYLMLWPNSGEQYLSQMTMTNVTVDGQAVTPKMEDGNGADGNLAARLALAAPLAPGATVEVSADFSIEAQEGISTANAARFGLTNGVLLAPTFYPLIPRITADGKWQTIPAPPGGDTTNSDTALYVWHVTAPADLSIAASGTVIDSSKFAITQTQTIVTGPMRDLGLVVGPLQLTQRAVGDITLNAWMLSEHANQANKMLDYAAGQIKTLQAEVGDYPFAELDLVDAPGAFGGIEYPGEVFIGVVGQGDFFEQATVHETGHQWFYSVVGDDQLLQPWLDEAAASYTEVLYEEKVHGAQAAASALRQFKLELNFTSHPNLPIGEAVGDYPSDQDYAIVVYAKGALFFDALRKQMGDATFFAFLKDYYAQYRYGFAASADFQAEAQKTCACDLSKMFDLWVYTGGPITP